MSHTLDVYLHDHLAGFLRDMGAGRLEFQYASDYVDAGHARLLSLSMPLGKEPFEAKKTVPFFAGLLPEGAQRDLLAHTLGASSGNIHFLLEAVGGDCAGAISVMPAGKPLPKLARRTEWLTEEQLHGLLETLKVKPLLSGEEGTRLSLAGAQAKLPVHFQDGKFALPLGSTPSTHILKPAISNPAFDQSVQNELFCMKLAAGIGLDVPRVFTHQVAGAWVYVIERYDRKQHTDGTWERIHQEDFCQALSIMPDRKYEREGGPKCSSVFEILKTHVATPIEDRIKFTKLQVFNYLIGNSDAHGKNFSLLYDGPRPRLAPAYDLLSTKVYPSHVVYAAMKIGGRDMPDEIYWKHWAQLVPDTAAAKKQLQAMIREMADAILPASEAVTQELHGLGISSPIYATIQEVIRQRKRFLERSPELTG